MRREAYGLVLVVVLLVALALSALLLTSVLFASLDAVSARNAQRLAVDEAAAEAGLQIGAAQVLAAWRRGAPTPQGKLGPWPSNGIAATARVTAPAPDRARVDARAGAPGRAVTRWVVLRRVASGAVVIARP